MTATTATTPEGSRQPVMRVEEVHVHYGSGAHRVHAVRGVSFDLHAGRRLALVGESGSGKSSIALAMLGMIDPPATVSGSIWLGERALTAMPERQLDAIRGKEIALVYQDPMGALDPLRSIGQQIVEALAAHRPGRGAAHRAEAVRLLAEVDVSNPAQRFDDYPHEYSGGMRQRVAIAMAIANNPRILVADEPTTALDVTTQASVMHLLVRLVSEHDTSLVLITHNLGLVAEYCDEVLVVYGGRVVERGACDEVFAQPAHPYTVALLGAVPRPGMSAADPLAHIDGLPPDMRHPIVGCSFAPRCSIRATLDDPSRCDTVAPVAVAFGSPSHVVECHAVADRAVAAHPGADFPGAAHPGADRRGAAGASQ